MNKKNNSAYIFLAITIALVLIIMTAIVILAVNQKKETATENEINVSNMIENSAPILDINNPQEQ